MGATIGKWLVQLLPMVLNVVYDFFKKKYDAYQARKKNEQDNATAIERSDNEQDQRPIEDRIGSPSVGERSDVDGSVIVSKLPGVKK